ncbi:hypothetical protein [Streptomyces silvensis]|uniref:hypothetical protein n=1 Tax=Streptomyces silvensis TaxID=1765722 RepID=UPI001F5159CB|nr:hypothetical protein [Streptomyces silvensis]
MTYFILGKCVCVPGVVTGTGGVVLPPGRGLAVAVAADAWVCGPGRETAAAPVLKPRALLKVRLLII